MKNYVFDSSSPLSIEDRNNFLESTLLFKSLDLYSLTVISSSLIHKHIPTGTDLELFHRNNSGLLFIYNGKVDISSLQLKKRIPLALLNKYEYFGDTYIINKYSRHQWEKLKDPFIYTTSTRVEILLLPEDKYDLLLSHPSILLSMKESYKLKNNFRQERLEKYLDDEVKAANLEETRTKTKSFLVSALTGVETLIASAPRNKPVQDFPMSNKPSMARMNSFAILLESNQLLHDATMIDKMKLANSHNYNPDLSNYSLKDCPNRPANILLPDVTTTTTSSDDRREREGTNKQTNPTALMKEDDQQINRSSLNLPSINMSSILSSVYNKISDFGASNLSSISADSIMRQKSIGSRQDFNEITKNLKVNTNHSELPNQSSFRSSFNESPSMRASFNESPSRQSSSIRASFNPGNETSIRASFNPGNESPSFRSSMSRTSSSNNSKDNRQPPAIGSGSFSLSIESISRKSIIPSSLNSMDIRRSANQGSPDAIKPILVTNTSLPILQALQKNLK